MRRRIIWLIVGAPLTLIAVAGGAAGAVPTLRHIVSGVWNAPDYLPALPDNRLVHYQPGAEDYARDVAALLPDAIARIEAAQGRRFAHPVTIGVYATPDAYAAANGLGSTDPVGVTFFGRVSLSPKLFRLQRQRLPAILTHELSHAHIQGWIGVNAFMRLPNWFKEGLAVMVSGGGGAELVSEPEARAAIRRGERIAIDDAGSLRHLADIRFDVAPQKASAAWYPVVLAYREGGMFVTYLHDSDEPAFARMINAILDGRSFVDAVSTGYHEDIQSLWHKFVQRNDGQS
jgi:hypothetical protein